MRKGREEVAAMARIVVLGWGEEVSLPAGLLLENGSWHEDGPILPLELSHVTRERRLVLVLNRDGEKKPVFWAVMGTSNVGEAVWNLSSRHGIRPEDVGYLDLEEGDFWCRTVDEYAGTLKRWAEELKAGGGEVDVIIWNDTRPNFEKKLHRPLSLENALWFLRRLTPEKRERAWNYLDNIPERTRTSLCAALLRERESTPAGL
jgi:hypothetical protein